MRPSIAAQPSLMPAQGADTRASVARQIPVRWCIPALSIQLRGRKPMMPPSELPVPRFSLAERDRRWSTVRAKMTQEGVDALVCVYHTGHHNHWQGDLQYLTQIGGNNVDASLVFPLEGEPTGFPINPYYEGPAARDWMSDFRPTRRACGDMIPAPPLAL